MSPEHGIERTAAQRTPGRLQGKVAVITGSGSGIGLAIATRFASEGAAVIAGDWNVARLDEAVARIRATGRSIIGVQGNIADRSTAESIVDLAITTYGRIDVLVNNAGVMDYMQGVAEVSEEVWRRVLSINLEGALFTMRRAVPQMIRQAGGSIINIASTAGIGGGSAGVAYTVSKHGVVGLTRNTAWMYAKQGIRCNAICPGGTRTNIAESMPQEQVDAAGAARAGVYAALMPALLEPEDIAALALFLASDESRHINGAIIPADAGLRAA
jgi:NAD(P)-dependent dehydrogenase (short-subunit alcohol dehydrogenase family)